MKKFANNPIFSFQAILGFVFLSMLLLSCKSSGKLNESNEQLSLKGRYQGIIPCADCEGIDTEIEFLPDGKCLIRSQYLGKGDSIYSDSYSIQWLPDSQRIVLRSEQLPEQQFYFKPELSRLIWLDQDGKEIQGVLASKYILGKVDQSVKGKSWQLIELNGVRIQPEGERVREALINFEENGDKVNGSGTCNRFFGSYKLKADGGIQFGTIGSTKMYCQGIEVEDQFFDVLNKTDHYLFRKDTLLFSQNGKVLARFIITQKEAE